MSTEPNKLTILVVDDEPQIRRLLKLILIDANYRVIEAHTGKDAIISAASNKPDVIILDLGLPDLDGQEVVNRLREWSSTPILVLSVRDTPEEKINALNNGADDYLTKPFDTLELLARIKAVYRRTSNTINTPVFEDGSLNVDFLNRQVFVNNNIVHLTPIEYGILKTLIQASGRIVTQSSLLKTVWGLNSETHSEYIRVHLTHLRKKLGTELGAKIKTETGIGYRFLYPTQKLN